MTKSALTGAAQLRQNLATLEHVVDHLGVWLDAANEARTLHMFHVHVYTYFNIELTMQQ